MPTALTVSILLALILTDKGPHFLQRKVLKERCGWIAPVTVYPGEDELLALAQGALRVMNGEEQVKQY